MPRVGVEIPALHHRLAVAWRRSPASASGYWTKDVKLDLIRSAVGRSSMRSGVRSHARFVNCARPARPAAIRQSSAPQRRPVPGRSRRDRSRAAAVGQRSTAIAHCPPSPRLMRNVVTRRRPVMPTGVGVKREVRPDAVNVLPGTEGDALFVAPPAQPDSGRSPATIRKRGRSARSGAGARGRWVAESGIVKRMSISTAPGMLLLRLPSGVAAGIGFTTRRRIHRSSPTAI